MKNEGEIKLFCPFILAGFQPRNKQTNQKKNVAYQLNISLGIVVASLGILYIMLKCYSTRLGSLIWNYTISLTDVIGQEREGVPGGDGKGVSCGGNIWSELWNKESWRTRTDAPSRLRTQGWLRCGSKVEGSWPESGKLGRCKTQPQSARTQNTKPCALLWAILELFLKTVWDFIKILVKVTLAAEPNNP